MGTSTALVRRPDSSAKTTSTPSAPSGKKRGQSRKTSSKSKAPTTTGDASKGQELYSTWKSTADGKAYASNMAHLKSTASNPSTSGIGMFYAKSRWASMFGKGSTMPDTFDTDYKDAATRCRVSDDFKSTLGKRFHAVEKMLQKEGNEDLRAYLAQRATKEFSTIGVGSSVGSQASLTEGEVEREKSARSDRKVLKAEKKSKRRSEAESKRETSRTSGTSGTSGLPTMPTTAPAEMSRSAKKRAGKAKANTESKAATGESEDTKVSKVVADTSVTETEGTKEMVMMDDRSLVDPHDHFQYMGNASTVRDLFKHKAKMIRAGKTKRVPISTKATIYDDAGQPDWSNTYRKEDRLVPEEATEPEMSLAVQSQSIPETSPMETKYDGPSEATPTNENALIRRVDAVESTHGAWLHLQNMAEAKEIVANKIKETILNGEEGWSLVGGVQEWTERYLDEESGVTAEVKVQRGDKETKTVMTTTTPKMDDSENMVDTKGFIEKYLAMPDTGTLAGISEAVSALPTTEGQKLLQYGDTMGGPTQTAGTVTAPRMSAQNWKRNLTKRIGFGTSDQSAVRDASSQNALTKSSALASRNPTIMSQQQRQSTWKDALNRFTNRVGNQSTAGMSGMPTMAGTSAAPGTLGFGKQSRLNTLAENSSGRSRTFRNNTSTGRSRADMMRDLGFGGMKSSAIGVH